MAVSNEDLAKLVVSLEATTTKYYNALRKAQQQTNSSASAIERRLTGMASNIDRTFANLGKRLSDNLTGPLAGIGAAFSVREVLRYADAWTEAGNQLAASSDITGIQARSLSELRKVADDSRAGFEETVKLYTRIQRSAGDVASSEEEIARATGIVNKAFKAGGAATSEFNAGILQLSQGLGSGVLQGDELRSVRENAPVLAKVIADYFGVTIAGLKELGSEGKLTSDQVFKAILAGEAQIESAFATTQSTIADGFTKVRNALVEYIGSSDQSLGATVALNVGLSALADNFNQVADVALKLASLIAGALVGRSLVAMIGGVSKAGGTVLTLIKAMRAATVAGAGLSTVLTAAGAAAGPIAAVLGGVALLALQHFTSESAAARAATEDINLEVAKLGINSIKTAADIREAASATSELTEETNKLREAERQRNLVSARENADNLRFGTPGDRLIAPLTGNADLTSAFTIEQRAFVESVRNTASEVDKIVAAELQKLAGGLRDANIPAQEVIDKLRILQQEPISEPVLELLDSLDKVAISLANNEYYAVFNNGSLAVEKYRDELISALELQRDFAGIRMEFGLQQDLDNLIAKLKENSISAEETKLELERLAKTNANFSEFLAGLSTLVAGLVEAANQAINAKDALDDLATSQDIINFRKADEASLAPLNANKAYLDSQEEILNMTKEERDLKAEILEIENEIRAGGGSPEAFAGGQDAIAALAARRLAQKEGDKKSGGSGKTDQEKYLETIKEQERANELLAQELELRAGLNPLIEDYGYAIERWKKQQELLNAAEEAGIELTPDLENKIGLIAEAYASGTAALEKLQETQDKARESLQEWLDLAKSATRSFIDDLIEGKSAAEALSNVLSQLGSYLIDLGLNTIFGGGGGGNGGLGLLGQLFGNFGGFKAGGGPVSKGQSYIVGEKRPELFVPQENGVIIPRVPTGLGGGGGISTPFQINIDATGADREGLMRVQQEIVNLRAQVPYLVRSQVSKRTQKGW